MRRKINFKLLSTLLSITVLWQSLVACTSGSSSSSGVWANQVLDANKVVNSTLALAVNNSSSYGVELVGCESSNFATIKLAKFLKPGYISTRTLNYAAKFSDLDYAGLGIYALTQDENSLLNNSMVFHDLTAGDGARLKCYYRVGIPEANKYLHFKQVFSSTKVDDFEPPVADTLELQMYAQEVLNNQVSTSGGYHSPKTTQRIIDESTLKLQGEMLRSLEFLKDVQATSRALDRFYSMLNHGQDLIQFTAAELNNIKALTAGKTDQEVQKLAEVIKRDKITFLYNTNIDYGTATLKYRVMDRKSLNFAKEYRVASSDYTKYFDSALLEFRLNDYHLIGSKLSNFIAQDVSHQVRASFVATNTVLKDGQIKGLLDKSTEDGALLIKEKLERPKFWTTGRKIAAGVTIAAVAVIITLAVILTKKSKAANNTLETTSLEAISAAEAEEWNNSHTANQQIAANSTFVSDVANNSSVANGGVLYFTDGADNDGQIGLRLNLSALTTPYVPISSAGDDPFRQGQYDATLQLSIQDAARVSSIDDQLFDLKRQAAQEQGFTTLAEDNRLAAPEWRLIGQNTSLDLLNSSLFLHANEDVNLALRVPGPSNELGNGLGLYYVADDGDANPVELLPVKSLSYRQLLDSFGESLPPPYLYSKFACSFPEVLGQDCSLTLHLGGYNDGILHQGGLYIADADSQTTRIPVLINYGLYTAPAAISPLAHDPNEYILEVANTRRELSANYSSIELSAVPPGTLISSNTCSGGLKNWSQCEIRFKFTNVAVGNYRLSIHGVKSSDLSKLSPVERNSANSSDTQTLAVNIQDF